MKKPKLLLMPGMTSPLFCPKTQKVYSTIREEAERRGFEYHIVYYPGQEGEDSGLMTYLGQLEKALLKCRELRPDWLIGFSSGCEVAAGCLGSSKEWVKHIQGTVLWGPCLKQTALDMFDSEKSLHDYIANFSNEPKRTYISLDFLDALPCISTLIHNASGNVRVARGSEDDYNQSLHVQMIAEAHQRMQSQYQTDSHTGIPGLRHSILAHEVTSEQLDNYFDCLFTPFSLRES
jgi:hypothetical protein